MKVHALLVKDFLFLFVFVRYSTNLVRHVVANLIPRCEFFANNFPSEMIKISLHLTNIFLMSLETKFFLFNSKSKNNFKMGRIFFKIKKIVRNWSLLKSLPAITGKFQLLPPKFSRLLTPWRYCSKSIVRNYNNALQAFPLHAYFRLTITSRAG